MVTVEQKLLHDQLLELKPEDASHDSLTCPICTPEGGVSMSDQFTQADIDAAVEAALKPLQDQLTTLTASKEEVEIQARIDEAVASLTTEVDDLKAKLDVATLEANTSKETLDNSLAYLTELKTQHEALEAIAAARDERVAKIAEVAKFDDAHVQANADRWAVMADEDFDAMIASFQVITAASTEGKKPPVKEVEIPAGTAMTASLGSGKTNTGDGLDLLREAQNDFLLGKDNRNVNHV